MTIEELHRDLLDAWNTRDAETYASLFTKDGSLVGFDGSSVDGRDAIREHIGAVFADHEVARYVRIVREVREIGDDVALLRAVVGMIPPDKQDINPQTNAVQFLVAVRTDEGGRVAHLQNTPAAFHGRPDEAERLTDELRTEGSL
jgi:uncharacterized protein (TIGR02246 family)